MSVLLCDELFNERTFYEQFLKDIDNARWHVWCQSPYLSAKRFQIVYPHFKAAAERDVQICLVFQKPPDWQDPSQRDISGFNSMIAQLEQANIHVNLRTNMHEKLAIIDDSIFWHGSLNSFSQANTTEHAERSLDYRKLRTAANLHRAYYCLSCPEAVRKRLMHFNSQDALELLGSYICSRRVQLGLTQVELAEATGVTQKTITDIETGKRDVRFLTLNKICAELGFDATSPALRAMLHKLFSANDKDANIRVR